MLIFEDDTFKNGTLSKIQTRQRDYRDHGWFVFRYQDPQNYYYVRASRSIFCLLQGGEWAARRAVLISKSKQPGGKC